MSDLSNILEKQIVLSLNKSWQPIGHLPVKRALVAIFSESNEDNAAMPLDIEMGVDENGNDVLIYANPVTLEEWLKLPIRPCDLYVNSAHQRIRVPTVIVSAQFNRMPTKRRRLGNYAILERDGFTCQYSGRKLPRSQLNVDHVVPRDRGGRDTWENMVACGKDINSAKGNRLNEEINLKLIKQPTAPKPLPVSATIREAKHPTWIPFLIN